MPDLDALRRFGKEITEGGQEFIDQNIDKPIDKVRADRAIQALAQQKAQAQMAEAQRSQQPLFQPPPPEIAKPLAGGFSGSQVAGLDQMQELKQRDAKMKAMLEAEAAAQAQSEAEFDPSSYQTHGQAPAPAPAPERFQTLRQNMTPAPQPAAPAATGPIEMSDDPDQMAFQLAKTRLQSR